MVNQWFPEVTNLDTGIGTNDVASGESVKLWCPIVKGDLNYFINAARIIHYAYLENIRAL